MEHPRVLLVDDDGSALFGLGHSLRGLGLELFFARSAEEALATLGRERIDVVVTDYRMPGTSGLELLKDVADWYPDTVRLMVTGHADLEVAAEVINRQLVFKLLQKPFDRDAFQLAIQEALAHLALERRSRALLACTGAGATAALPAPPAAAPPIPRPLSQDYADWPEEPAAGRGHPRN